MLNIYRNLLWFFKREKKIYIILGILVVFIAYMATIPPKLVGNVIDLMATGNFTIEMLIINGSLIILIPITIYLLNYFYHKNLFLKGQQLAKELRVNYLIKLFASDSKVFEQYSKGDLISRLSSDMLSITQAATYLLSDLIYCSSLIIIVLGLMIFQISLKLTVVGFLIIPISFYFLNKWRQSMRKYYRIHRGIFAKFFDSILESIEGMRVVRAYVMEEEDIKKNNHYIDEDINSWIRITKFENVFGPMFAATIAVATFLTFSYGSYLVITSQILPGELITFYMYITMVAGPINVLANIMNVISQAQIGQERYYEIMEIENNVITPENPKQLLEFETLEYRSVYFKYPFDEDYVLKDIDLNIFKGQTIGIVGPTGSGKSTFIKHILREFNVTSGQIKVNGNDISEYSLEEVRALVGYVPQDHILFKGSVKDNLELVMTLDNQAQMMKAIKIAAFERDLEFMSDGMETPVGESGTGLSGGQKQRLSIARALINEPPILILDDSLSAVDTKTEREIIDNLKVSRQNKTNIIITHRFSVLEAADIIYVFEDGKITEMGNHQLLMAIKGWYYEQWIEQTKGNL